MKPSGVRKKGSGKARRSGSLRIALILLKFKLDVHFAQLFLGTSLAPSCSRESWNVQLN